MAASNYRLFMLLEITGPNDSWIIALLKGTLMQRYENLHVKIICQRFYNIIPFIL